MVTIIKMEHHRVPSLALQLEDSVVLDSLVLLVLKLHAQQANIVMIME